MVKVLFKGWNHGLQKISLTELFQQEANLNLKEAKSKTDALLNSEPFVIETNDVIEAEELIKKARAIGAVCEFVKEND